jgi:hypothetical protein
MVRAVMMRDGGSPVRSDSRPAAEAEMGRASLIKASIGPVCSALRHISHGVITTSLRLHDPSARAGWGLSSRMHPWLRTSPLQAASSPECAPDKRPAAMARCRQPPPASRRGVLLRTWAFRPGRAGIAPEVRETALMSNAQAFRIVACTVQQDESRDVFLLLYR